jgi:vacuolar-type H+-ATPase subunit F/Vma7
MEYSVHVICRPEVATGFSLAGCPPLEASDGAAAAERLFELTCRPESGVILMQDDLYERLPADVLRYVSKRPLPMLVPFPGPVWDESLRGPEGYIVEMLHQAIGYRVRLR